MIRATAIILTLLVSPAFGFGVPSSLKRQADYRRKTCLFQKKISFSEYKHDYVDPITPHATESKVKSHMEPSKRAIADEFWKAQFEQDKEKLHQMNENNPSRAEATLPKDAETWPHYKHEYVDPITPHEIDSKVESHMDPGKRAIADEYWLQTFLEDKKKLHKKMP